MEWPKLTLVQLCAISVRAMAQPSNLFINWPLSEAVWFQFHAPSSSGKIRACKTYVITVSHWNKPKYIWNWLPTANLFIVVALIREMSSSWKITANWDKTRNQRFSFICKKSNQIHSWFRKLLHKCSAHFFVLKNFSIHYFPEQWWSP